MKIFLFLLALFTFLYPAARVNADHLTPERVVEGKYTVILLMIPEAERMRLRFLFRDVHTGKNIATPVLFRLSIAQEQAEAILHEREGETNNGIIEFLHEFPAGGLYEVQLEFETGEEPGTVYHPDTWTLWVPGQTKSFFQRYPIGLTEIAGFLSLFGALGVITLSVWFKRARGKALELSFFGIFGSEKSASERKAIIKRERRKYSSASHDDIHQAGNR